MTKPEHAPGYVPNPHYTQEDWDEVCDNPELTQEDFAKARPGHEVFPELVAAMRRRGRPKLDVPKRQVTLRLDGDVLERLRASGPGWQGRVNAMLRDWLHLNES